MTTWKLICGSVNFVLLLLALYFYGWGAVALVIIAVLLNFADGTIRASK